MAGSIKGITVEIGGNTTGLSKALGGVNKEINSTQSELKQVEKLLKLDPTNTTLLAQKQELLAKSISSAKDKLDTLKTAQEQVERQFASGEIDEGQYRAFQREIVSAENQLKKFEGNLNNTENQMKDMGDSAKDAESKVDDLGDSAKTAGDKAEKGGKGFDMFKSAAGAIGTGLTAAVSAVAATGGALIAVTENTREYREDLGKLNTAFENAGFSAQSAADVYSGFYGILGETDRSIEAVNHLAQLTNNQEDLSKWTDICAGVTATFGDSLPIEGLTEAANETAKTSAVTGVLADALNWVGVSEDDFNNKLSACSSEQERSALITDTLNGLYKESADTYKEMNADIIESRNASLQFNNALAQIGAAAEPIMAGVKSAVAGGLETVANGLNLITSGDTQEGIQAINDGIKSISDNLSEQVGQIVDISTQIIGALLNTIIASLPSVLDMAVSIIQTLITGIQSSLPQITSSAASILTTLITGLVQILPQLLQTGVDVIVNLANGIASQLPTLIPLAIECIMNLADTLLSNINQIIDAGINLILGLTDGIIQALPTLIDKAPMIIEKVASALIDNLPKIYAASLQLIGMLVKGIIGALPNLASSSLQIVTTIKDYLISYFTTVIPTVGKNLIEGLYNGIKNNTGWLLGKIKEWCTSVLDGIKAFFGIHSPSRYTAEFGKYLVQGLAVGITEDMSAEKALEQKCKNLSDILKDFTDTSDLIISGAEKEYNLWEMQNQNATEDEKLAKKAQMLTKQLNNQEDKIKATNDALWECRQLTGENSDESLKLKNQLLDEQIAYEKLTQSINENSQARAENNASKYAAFLDYKDKFGGYLNSVGISDSEIDAAARKSSGYTGTTVVNNNYGVTPQTAYTVAQGTKRTLNNLVMAGVI